MLSEPVRDGIQDDVIRFGEDVGATGVGRRASQEATGIQSGGSIELPQPSALGNAVVIDERKQFAACGARSQIPGARGTSVILAEKLQRDFGPERLRDNVQRLGTAVVHDEDFKMIARVIQRG